MKHTLKTLLLALVMLCGFNAHAVYVTRMPVNQIQPNGDTVHFFVTGDEFYHRYHDANDYTIVQARSGYWVYATADAKGQITPTAYPVGTINPATLGVAPGIAISNHEYQLRRKQWEVPEQYRTPAVKTEGRNHGDFCNLVIFIRFADDTVYTRSLQNVDRMFSDSSRVNSNSVYSYFKRASYNKLFIHTYYAPTPDSNRILSYQDSHPRAYYMPWTESNPLGYTNYGERSQREFDLLIGAVNYINNNSPVPTEYNLDCDNDGTIDNVNFVVKGTYTGWSDLLWPHKWNLYGDEAYINGKRVNTFNFALEGSGDDYFGTSTFCHEMSHSLGAPDLYHYNSGTNISPVGIWDLMASNSKPPQHSTAYVKWKYGNWLDSIPLITTSGTYTLSSVADSTPGTMALRFPSSDPDQFYVVEYRDNSEYFETTLPGKGIIIYRVDTRFNGNADWDGAYNFNEIWVFRPNSNDDETSGNLQSAFFAPNRNRTEFSPSTNPYPYLSDGTRDYSFSISNITTPGNTVSFRYTNHTVPANLRHGRTTTVTTNLQWDGNADAYRLGYRAVGESEYTYLLVYDKQVTLTHLTPNTQYEWIIRSLYNEESEHVFADSSRLSQVVSFHTELCNNATTDTVGWYTIEDHNTIPFMYNNNYNCSQSIYCADELNGAKSISSIHYHYAYTTPLNKENCTIYLANVSINHFHDSASLVPASQMTKVYEGTLHFVQGWNEFVLDTPFEYSGTDNLLVCIDDNSGTPSRAGERFYCHTTSEYRSIIYYNNSEAYNPDPDQDTVKGTRNRSFYRSNMKFTGCPNNNSQVYVCVLSENESRGNTTGEGLYNNGETINIQAVPRNRFVFLRWDDDNTDNPRSVTLTSDTVFVAYFTYPLGIDPVTEQGGYTLITQGLNLKVYGAEGDNLEVFDLMGRRVASIDSKHASPAVIRLPHSGIYILRGSNSAPVKFYVR